MIAQLNRDLADCKLDEDLLKEEEGLFASEKKIDFLATNFSNNRKIAPITDTVNYAETDSRSRKSSSSSCSGFQDLPMEEPAAEFAVCVPNSARPTKKRILNSSHVSGQILSFTPFINIGYRDVAGPIY